MTKKEKNVLIEKIQSSLSSIEKNIVELQKFCETIAPECALGDLTRFELMNEQEVSKKALLQAQIRSKKLYYALSKTEEDDFGLCSECEEEISYERLLLVPESRLCIKCASIKK